MAQPKVKALPPKRELTPEEKEKQIRIAYFQKRAALTETILMNMMQSQNLPSDPVTTAIQYADQLMKELYGKEVE